MDVAIEIASKIQIKHHSLASAARLSKQVGANLKVSESAHVSQALRISGFDRLPYLTMFNTTTRSLLASSLRAKPARNPFNYLPTRTIITVKEIKVFFISLWLMTVISSESSLLASSVQATGTGSGRYGFVTSNGTSLELGVPKELGGDGKKGYNPEQLFAMGYACT